MTTDISGRIRFSSTILKRLGEELNPNVDQGLLELVKNAYDADATECHIWLESNGDPSTVVVEDNGSGMDGEDIVSGWLVLGSSQKQTSDKTQLGRTPAGNKGLGRLAALRLGKMASMFSRPTSGGTYSVELNWELFDRAATVDEVEVNVKFDGANVTGTGTRIELTGLRAPIGRIEARRLARALVLLADPFDDVPSSFRPHLHSVEFADLAEQVKSRYFDQSEYHLTASVRDGLARAEVTDWRGQTLWKASNSDLTAMSTDSSYEVPDSDFDIWAFILSGQNFSTRPVQLGAVREWLGHFGGVHVYENGIRVAPYGNPGNDWLDLNLARVRSPEERPGTNTAIGRVRISDPDDRLVQKTDRSGFIESVAFDELRRFCTDALEWMARRRIEAAERKRRAAREGASSEAKSRGTAIREQIEKVDDPGTKRQLQEAFNDYDRARNRETDALRQEVQLYRTLSTAGITAATFAHESNGNPLKRLSLIANTLKTALRRDLPDKFDSKYKKPLENISQAVESLSVLSSATLELISQEKRRVGRVQLNETVRAVARIFRPFLSGRQVKLELALSGPGEPFVRGSAAAVESVVTNLINNSLAAFERVDLEQRVLKLSSRVDEGVWELTVADNGPGIEGISLRDIWLPGQTQRPGGTGLGLTIVRDSVADLGGSVEASAHGDLGGATFIVRLPTLGVDLA